MAASHTHVHVAAPGSRWPQCVALSQDDTVLAAGDISGRILIWRNPAECLPHPSRAGGGGGGGGSHQQQQQQQGEGGGGGGRVPPPVPCTTVHWHAAPVGCLSFSPDSVYLRSGGREGVLVSWHLETLKPAFLPRRVVGRFFVGGQDGPTTAQWPAGSPAVRCPSRHHPRDGPAAAPRRPGRVCALWTWRQFGRLGEAGDGVSLHPTSRSTNDERAS